MSRDLLFEADARLSNRPEQPFSVGQIPLRAPVYLLVRLLSLQLSEDVSDPMWVEESLIHVIASCVNGPPWARVPRAGTRARARELVRAAKQILAERFEQSLTVTTVASSLAVSPFHLCRVFRAETGYTLHAYLTEMRVRTSLEYLIERRDELTGIAMDLGFCSHSHFTAAFREKFGLTPSEFRTKPKMDLSQRSITGS